MNFDELDDSKLRKRFDSLLAMPDGAQLACWLERLLQVYTPLSNEQCKQLGRLVQQGVEHADASNVEGDESNTIQ
jgi:hypothetical protein